MSNNIDQYAKVKLGGGNEFMANEPVEFMSGEWVKWILGDAH